MRAWRVALLTVALLSLSGCGYNRMMSQDEGVKAAWSEVVNQYQRRADLIPNLVNTVKGYAAQEQRVLIGVTEARAKVGSIQVTPEVLNNPQLFQKYQAAQGELTSALKSLLAVTENYPQLKSDQNFRDLQSQLEGTENRITVARNRYIQAVQDYNTTVRTFPNNLTAKMFGFQPKPSFSVANEQQISTAPTVSFDTTTPAAPGNVPRACACGTTCQAIMTDRARRTRRWAGFALPLLLLCSSAASAQIPAAAPGLQPIPPLSARVTDLTGTLTAQQQSALEQKLAAFESAKGSQLAVLIVPTTEPEEIEPYSIRVVEQWKLGRSKVDDGALLLVAKNDRRVRIEVGRGLWKACSPTPCPTASSTRRSGPTSARATSMVGSRPVSSR